jgi:hypothetical protein
MAATPDFLRICNRLVNAICIQKRRPGSGTFPPFVALPEVSPGLVAAVMAAIFCCTQ